MGDSDDGDWLDWSDLENAPAPATPAEREREPTGRFHPAVPAPAAEEAPRAPWERSPTSPPPAGYQSGAATARPAGLEPKLAWLESTPGVRGYALADSTHGVVRHRGAFGPDDVGGCDYLVALGQGIGQLLGIGGLQQLHLEARDRTTLVRHRPGKPSLYLRLGPDADVAAIRREVDRS
jgi:hypothetical protein